MTRDDTAWLDDSKGGLSSLVKTGAKLMFSN